MKKFLSLIIGALLLATPAYAQVFKTNQLVSPITAGFVYTSGVGTSTLTASSSPWLSIFTFGTATGTAATTTNLFSTTASTTNLFGTLINGFGLITCNGANQALTWSSGLFGCATISGGGGGSGNVATSSAETSGRVPFWTSTGATPATLSGGVSAFTFDSTLSKLTVTNASTTNLSVALSGLLKGNGSSAAVSAAVAGTDYQAPISATWPILFSGNTVSWGGLSTSTTPTAGQLAYYTSGSAIGAVSTTTASCSSGISCTSHTIVGTSPVSITNTGVLSLAQTFGTAQTGALTIGTSTQTLNGITYGNSITNSSGTFTITPSNSGTLTVGGGGTGQTTFSSSQLLYGAGSGAVQSVATSSATCGSGVTCSTHTVVGTVAPAFSLDQSFGAVWTTASTTFVNGVTIGRATTTNATTTTISAATASTTNQYVSSLGRAAGTFVAADPSGQLIATSTPSSAATTQRSYLTKPVFSMTASYAQDGDTGSTTQHMGKIYVPNQITFTKGTVGTNNTFSSRGINVGIYSDDCSSLLKTITFSSLNSGATTTVSTASYTLSAGSYYLGWVYTGTGTGATNMATAGDISASGGFSFIPAGGDVLDGSFTTTAGTLASSCTPSTLTPGTTNTVMIRLDP